MYQPPKENKSGNKLQGYDGPTCKFTHCSSVFYVLVRKGISKDRQKKALVMGNKESGNLPEQNCRYRKCQ
jgi:hypothetical protein